MPLKKSNYLITLLILLSPICCSQASNHNDNAISSSTTFPEKIIPLTIKGANFINPEGIKTRFWGVNLTAFYPTHAIADKTAENLSSIGINMVRPHHMMRSSRDWNPRMQSGALVDYKKNSREFDKEALDKFDYLNAALRKKGIYLAFSLRWSRSYKEGDVSIIKTTPEDEENWLNAWKEIKSWHWQKQHDVVKSLSLIDERFMAIDEEFANKLLQHVNPYTKKSYAQDPQVATIEIINEYGAEYTFICNNKFPPYFHNKLQHQWDEYSRKHGTNTVDFYAPKTKEQRIARLDFLIGLDKARMQRMIKISRDLGYQGAITYSNLFRGENLLSMQNNHADYLENHAYANPYIVDTKDDFFHSTNKALLKDKPFIVSEFNVTENKELRNKHQNKRTMLTAATVAYASLHNWSGITWFSWQHGTNKIADNGWSIFPGRNISLGDMVKDEMQLDHFKTAAIIFRKGYIQQAESQTMIIDPPYKVDDYHKLIAGKYQYKKGWQNIHSIRKSFSPASPELLKAQQSAQWMNHSPESPLISETGQIIKDIERKQLTATATKAEIFTGYLDDKAPAGLKFLNIEKNHGFATIMLASNDGVELTDSKSILISKTYMEISDWWLLSNEGESDSLTISLKTNKPHSEWTMEITRPITHKKVIKLTADGSGKIKLPEVHWYQIELLKTQ